VLNEIGVVAGNDMTPECAFVKLSYLLAQDHLSLEAKKRWLGMSMVGEMASVAT
jgi:lysophospholipase